MVDLRFPDSQGAELVRAAAAAATKARIVVLTGQDDLHTALEAREAGSMEHLRKKNPPRLWGDGPYGGPLSIRSG